jgi:hypothetical protein
MTIRGSVDSLSPEGASGWAFGSARGPDHALVIQALMDGRVIGETVADQDRPDLAAAGLGDGRCGFALAFYDAPIDPALLPFVSVRPRGGDVELPRTNLTGFGEYFRAIHSRYPGMGRHRSVFGGLWTDRTDARRLLAGRVTVGSTPMELRDTLRTFISEGYVVLRGGPAKAGLGNADFPAAEVEADAPLYPSAGPETQRLLEAVPDLVFGDEALGALRAVLDDNPVAYRVVLTRGGKDPGVLAQPSSAERLPSPAECLLLVTCVGGSRTDGISIDIVSGSHELPEFTPHGRSRWLADPMRDREPAAVELAREFGASLETVEIGPQDVALLGPGTVHRVRAAEDGAAALCTWCVPSRISPTRFLEQPDAGSFVLRHRSGAMLAV